MVSGWVSQRRLKEKAAHALNPERGDTATKGNGTLRMRWGERNVAYKGFLPRTRPLPRDLGGRPSNQVAHTHPLETLKRRQCLLAEIDGLGSLSPRCPE